MVDEQQANQEISDEEAILKIAQAMKDNAPAQDEKKNVHTFLVDVVQAEEIDKVSKLGNLRDDKEMNELGVPAWNVRGSLEMSRMSSMLMSNQFFADFFDATAAETLATSLSRSGFLVRQASVQTKQISDITRRKKTNKGWFKSSTEQSGGDTTGSAGGDS